MFSTDKDKLEFIKTQISKQSDKELRRKIMVELKLLLRVELEKFAVDLYKKVYYR